MLIETVAVTPEDLPQLYAIVREEFPHLALEHWRAYASTYLDQDEHGDMRGILAARTSLSRYRGLLFYAIETTLLHQRAFVMPHVILPHVVDRETVMQSLLNRASEIAGGHRCGIMQARVSQTTGENFLACCHGDAAVVGVCIAGRLPQSGAKPAIGG